jgi:hypothetical protein
MRAIKQNPDPGHEHPERNPEVYIRENGAPGHGAALEGTLRSSFDFSSRTS